MSRLINNNKRLFLFRRKNNTTEYLFCIFQRQVNQIFIGYCYVYILPPTFPLVFTTVFGPVSSELRDFWNPTCHHCLNMRWHSSNNKLLLYPAFCICFFIFTWDMRQDRRFSLTQVSVALTMMKSALLLSNTVP